MVLYYTNYTIGSLIVISHHKVGEKKRIIELLYVIKGKKNVTNTNSFKTNGISQL